MAAGVDSYSEMKTSLSTRVAQARYSLLDWDYLVVPDRPLNYHYSCQNHRISQIPILKYTYN